MPSSNDLLVNIKSLEHLHAEMILKGNEPAAINSVADALNELYWAYKYMTATELDEEG